MSRRRFLHYSVLLLLLTGLIRAAWLVHFPVDPIEPVDAEGYHLLALNLLAGRGFSLMWDPPFCPTALRAPLYPLFLVGGYHLLGAEPERAVLLQILLEVLTTALVIRLGRQVGRLAAGRSWRSGMAMGGAAGLLYALNGTTQRYTGYLFSEALLLPLMAAALLLTVAALRRGSRATAVLAGTLWGLALLTKPNIQFLVVAVGGLFVVRTLWVAIHREEEKARMWCAAAGLFCGVVLLVLAPWVLRNRKVMGRWIVTTAFEENLARVSAVATLSEVRGLRAEPWTSTWEQLYGELVEQASQRYHWEVWNKAIPPCVAADLRHQQVAQVARGIVSDDPAAFLAAHFRGVLRSLLDVGHRTWYPALTGQAWETTGVLDDIWRRMGESLRISAVGDALHALWLERVTRAPLGAALLWWGLLAARVGVGWLGLRGLWRLRGAPWVALLLVGTTTYLLLLPGPIAYDRFYLPAIPGVVVLLAVGQSAGLSGS